MLATVAGPTMLLALVWLSRYRVFKTGSNTRITNTFLYSIILVVVTSLVVVALSQTGRVCRVLNMAALRYIGRVSYSMYLIHVTVIMLVNQRIANRLIACLVAFGCVVLYASITWYGFEQRLLKLRVKTVDWSLNVRNEF